VRESESALVVDTAPLIIVTRPRAVGLRLSRSAHSRLRLTHRKYLAARRIGGLPETLSVHYVSQTSADDMDEAVGEEQEEQENRAELRAAAGAADGASFSKVVLTEIYLCNVCSCQEILRRNGRGQSCCVQTSSVPC
jgi:hypothetical protein